MPFKIIRDDITRVRADAIVNSANPEPCFASGTDAAIYKAAGADDLLAERKKTGRIAPGAAAVTAAFQLPAKYIIHTVGPVWIDGNHGEFAILRSCYRKSLRLADQLGCESIAFPLIAAGVYGFPKDRALDVALSMIREHLENSDLEVTLVVFGGESYQIASGLIERIEEYIDENYVAVRRQEEAYGATIGEPWRQEEHDALTGEPWVQEEHDALTGEPWRQEEHDALTGEPWVQEEHDALTGEPWRQEEHDVLIGEPGAQIEHDASIGKPWRREEHDALTGEPWVQEEHDALTGEPGAQIEHDASTGEPWRQEEHDALTGEPWRQEEYSVSIDEPGERDAYSALIRKRDKKVPVSKRRRKLSAWKRKAGGVSPDEILPHEAMDVMVELPEEVAAADAAVVAESTPVNAAPKSAMLSLEDAVNNLGESFQARLLRMIDERGMTDPEVYKRANIDRKLFSKIRCSEHYIPKKKTIVALAIALHLNLEDTGKLLASAGLMLTNNSKADVIVRFCLENEIYDIFEVNALLFQFHQPILG